jgi:DNA polymerase (family 10)
VSGENLPSNARLAALLELYADLLEIGGETSRHRLLAYRRGAARIRQQAESVARLALAGRAVDLPDIGRTLQDKVVQVARTGTIASLDRLRERVPEGLADIARLEGIGPGRARAIWSTLQVADVDALRAALDDGRLAGVPGIGPTLIGRLREQLADPAAGRVAPERVSIGRALPLAEAIARDLADARGAVRVEVAGGLRRGAETVHDIDLAAATTDPDALLDALAAHPATVEVLSRGTAGAAVMTQAGIRVEVRVTPPERFGNLWQHLTGSRAHNIRLRERAVARGLSVSERGVATGDAEPAGHAEEAGVYAALGLPWIPPELREDTGEIAVADAGLLPQLVRLEDLRGDLHLHTTWSDGRDTLEAMVEGARARGLRYLAVSDHSVSLAMARGLDPDRVRRQWDEIDALNDRVDGIRVLKACEVDVLADGRLDYDDDLLAGFDWVTASLHSGFRQSPERLTERVLGAIAHPFVDAVGHPTGRMFGRREGYALDLDRVIEAAARTGTFLEINAQPRRLDLNAEHARRALAGGARLVIGSDAHSVDELDLRRYGVLVARRAGADAAAIGNTWPLETLLPGRGQRGG